MARLTASCLTPMELKELKAKATAKYEEGLHAQYSAFCDRGRVLSEKEQHPFRHALKRLQRALLDPLKFEAFVQGGVATIFLVADEVKNPQFKGHFPSAPNGRLRHPLVRWVSEEMKQHGITPKKYRGFMSIATPPGEREDKSRHAFTLLRDTLADKRKRHALAEIGPVALYLWYSDQVDMDTPEHDVHPSILISNYIPGIEPNMDYSIVPDGTHDDAVDGIWFHS